MQLADLINATRPTSPSIGSIGPVPAFSMPPSFMHAR